MKKCKGFDVIENYPEDGWLKGYFYARELYISSIILEIPIMRDYFSEGVIIKIYKPYIQTFFK